MKQKTPYIFLLVLVKGRYLYRSERWQGEEREQLWRTPQRGLWLLSAVSSSSSLSLSKEPSTALARHARIDIFIYLIVLITLYVRVDRSLLFKLMFLFLFLFLQCLKKNNQKPLFEALQKIKEGHAHIFIPRSLSLYTNMHFFSRFWGVFFFFLPYI